MRIGFRWASVGGPTRMTDAHRARDRLAAQHRFEIAQFAFAAANRDMAVVQNRNTGGIVTAIFQFSQALENEGRCFACADVADDAAHYFLLPFIFLRFCSVQPWRSCSSRGLNTKAPAGMSCRTVLAVATYTSSPIAIGATRVVSLPTWTRSPMVRSEEHTSVLQL